MALTLAIGFLVDDAIVFLENIVRRVEARRIDLSRDVNSAREICFTILSMTLSLAAVFIPLVFMTGLMGRIFREFAVTIIVAIFASGLVSLTLTPLMCARLLAERGEGHQDTWMERVHRRSSIRDPGVYGERSTGSSITAGLAAPDRGRVLRHRRLVFLHSPSHHTSCRRATAASSAVSSSSRKALRLSRCSRHSGQARSDAAGESRCRQIFHRGRPFTGRTRALFTVSS